MRIVLVLVIALAGCAKKSKPPAAPAAIETKESAPGGGPADDADEQGKTETQTKGDPCDGGESK
jgi:uncharacterized lipoprotein YbaY